MSPRRATSRPEAPLAEFADTAYRAVPPEALRRRERRSYDLARASLEALGFRHLANIEALDVSLPHRGRRDVFAALISAAGETMASVYQTRARILRVLGQRLRRRDERERRIIDLGTRLHDGTLLITSNTRGTPRSQAEVPGIHHQHYPLDTPLRELVAVHAYELKSLVATRQSPPDLIDSLNALLTIREDIRRRLAKSAEGTDGDESMTRSHSPTGER
ncbi:MAG: hypothetical protein KAI47_04395 [Deltaproteobacteria bacterium]|nr:hypothetical protein [Deltaproteobacteria bacterium]